MAQRTGALVFDERTDRYDIRFDLNTYYGGLHCGECFDVFVRGKWKLPGLSMATTGILWVSERGFEWAAGAYLTAAP